MLETPYSLSDQSVKLDRIGQSAGKSFSYLLGVYLGDGCVTTQKGRLVFRMNTKDEDFALSVERALNCLTKHKIGIHKVIDNRWNKPCMTFQLRCGDTDIAKILREHTENKTKIPDYVFDWNTENQKAFIAGLMDSEGYVSEKKTIPSDCNILTNRRFHMGFKSCDIWVNDFVKILQNVGVKIGNISQEKPLKEGYKIPTRFQIKMKSWVDANCYFTIARKQKRVETWKSFPAYTQRTVNPKRLTPETICLALKRDDIVRPAQRCAEGGRNVLSV